MATVHRGDFSLYYEESGTGFPVLLFAPGGMRSSIEFWQRSPWNPIEALSPHSRVIAMDQQNAGRSKAPVTASDGWHSYAADHVALLDALGIERGFVYSVSQDFVRSCDVPMLVLMGDDLKNPSATSREIAEIAPRAELIDHWKGPDIVGAAVESVIAFLKQHTSVERAEAPVGD